MFFGVQNAKYLAFGTLDENALIMMKDGSILKIIIKFQNFREAIKLVIGLCNATFSKV